MGLTFMNNEPITIMNWFSKMHLNLYCQALHWADDRGQPLQHPERGPLGAEHGRGSRRGLGGREPLLDPVRPRPDRGRQAQRLLQVEPFP